MNPLYLSIASLCLGVMLIGYMIYQYKTSNIDDIVLRQELSNLKAADDSLNADITTLRAADDSSNTNITTLRAADTNILSKYDSLNTDITALRAADTNILSKYNSLNTDITALRAADTNILSKYDSLNTDIATADTYFNTLIKDLKMTFVKMFNKQTGKGCIDSDCKYFVYIIQDTSNTIYVWIDNKMWINLKRNGDNWELIDSPDPSNAPNGTIIMKKSGSKIVMMERSGDELPLTFPDGVPSYMN